MTGTKAAISIMSEELTWSSLYYFTFEMKLIQCVLETEDTKVLPEKIKKLKRLMYTLIAITTFAGIIYSIYALNEIDYHEFFSEYYSALSLSLNLSRVLVFLSDLYV